MRQYYFLQYSIFFESTVCFQRVAVLSFLIYIIIITDVSSSVNRFLSFFLKNHFYFLSYLFKTFIIIQYLFYFVNTFLIFFLKNSIKIFLPYLPVITIKKLLVIFLIPLYPTKIL
uniref:Transmembrane protein n=1 Tax=Siphoviridae sp. ctXZx16 TaxID=2826371 RepID=A0A8S5MLM4_9CAUD|nr:MAG TPA: hypothetical protein [Siphoviridae sp. ctXZx16]